MLSYRLTDKRPPDRYLVHSRIMMAGVITLVTLMVPVVLTRAFHLNQELASSRLEVTDDQTWNVAQLEVEYLKLAVAVGELQSNAPQFISVEELRKRSPDIFDRFDIFYSRVGTVDQKIRTWSENSPRWDESLRVLDRLKYRRDALAAMLDRSSEPGGRIWLQAFEATVAATATDVRELSVKTLADLSAQANERRLLYIDEQATLLAQSLTMVLVLAAISLVALVLFRQVGIRAEAEHRLIENLYRVFDAKPDAIVITDLNRQILWKNVAANELLGLNATGELAPRILDFYFPGLQRVARMGKTHPLDRSDQSCTFRDIVRPAGGGTLAVEVTKIKLVSESGDNMTALFVRNISETQRALRALRRERRSAEGQAERHQRFLAVMSHEIRSPLHAILASLDLAGKRPGASEMADLHQIATDAARVALREADAVLKNGRNVYEVLKGEPEVFSPSQTLADLIEMNGPTAQNAGTELALEIGAGAEGDILGLRASFWHAAANLLGNAVKFTKAGTIALRLTKSGSALRVEVADSGPGVDPELRQTIFRDHYTRDPATGTVGKGAGLGLGLFVEAVQAMSGHYGLESVVGKGSTFWFTFPAAPVGQPQAVESQDMPSSNDLPSGLSILVVDDSQVNRTLIRQMFATLGQEADLAASGVEAVKRAQTVRYDLILMDLSMPNMDGYTAAAQIRQAGASQSAAIVALTANVLSRQEVDKANSDFNGFLLKPLRLQELRTWLAEGMFRPSVCQEDLLPLVDLGIAQDLLTMLPPPTIETLVAAFFDETRDLAEWLYPGMKDEGLPTKFHRIAGSASMLGAGRLRALALDGELASKETERGLSPTFRVTWMQAIAETARSWELLLQGKAEPAAANDER